PAGVSGGASAGRSGERGGAAAPAGGNRSGRPVRGRLGLFPGLVDALPGGTSREPDGQVGPLGGRPPTVGPPRPRPAVERRPVSAPAPARPSRAGGTGVPVLAA
ncbi:hypothetical protein AB0F68_29465, partial [Micromonospora sp. NPDC023966]